MPATPSPVRSPSVLPRVGDHLALDFINTEAQAEGRAVDAWATDDDVLGWLAESGLAPEGDRGERVPGELLERARCLRSTVRALVSERRRGALPDLRSLNEFLHPYATAPSVDRSIDGTYQLVRVERFGDAHAVLGPVAEATARLLIEGDFTLVRQCEHDDCVLWFYDRTKSHKRRWCSMALCGNRHKAERFRKRNELARRATPAPE